MRTEIDGHPLRFYNSPKISVGSRVVHRAANVFSTPGIESHWIGLSCETAARGRGSLDGIPALRG
jgi:hypothetical protein